MGAVPGLVQRRRRVYAAAGHSAGSVHQGGLPGVDPSAPVIAQAAVSAGTGSAAA